MFPQTQERLSLHLCVSAVFCYWKNITDKGTLMKEGSCQLMVYKGMWSILEAKVCVVTWHPVRKQEEEYWFPALHSVLDPSEWDSATHT